MAKISRRGHSATPIARRGPPGCETDPERRATSLGTVSRPTSTTNDDDNWATEKGLTAAPE